MICPITVAWTIQPLSKLNKCHLGYFESVWKSQVAHVLLVKIIMDRLKCNIYEGPKKIMENLWGK